MTSLFFKRCLFSFGCAGSSLLPRLSSCGMWASRCSGGSCCGVQPLGCTSFSSCSSWAPEHRLSSPGSWTELLRGMWDLPNPWIKPVSPALADSLPPSHQGNPTWLFLKGFSNFPGVDNTQTGMSFLFLSSESWFWKSSLVFLLLSWGRRFSDVLPPPFQKSYLLVYFLCCITTTPFIT